MKNKIPSYSSTMKLSSMITMETLVNFFSDVGFFVCFFCMTSLAVTSSMLKTSMKFWGTTFRFWLRPCNILCYGASFKLHVLRIIRKYLTTDKAKLFCNVFINSHLKVHSCKLKSTNKWSLTRFKRILKILHSNYF